MLYLPERLERCTYVTGRGGRGGTGGEGRARRSRPRCRWLMREQRCGETDCVGTMVVCAASDGFDRGDDFR